MRMLEMNPRYCGLPQSTLTPSGRDMHSVERTHKITFYNYWDVSLLRLDFLSHTLSLALFLVQFMI